MTPEELALSRRTLLAAIGVTTGVVALGIQEPAHAAVEPAWGHPLQFKGVISTIFNPGKSVNPKEREHFGIDFDNGYIGSRGGDRIFAVADGTIVFSGWNGGHGYQVRVAHGGGWESGYSHTPSASHLPVGTPVQRGDHIAVIGNTGHSFGPHLHLEIRSPNGLVDPAVRVMGAPLPGQTLPPTEPATPARSLLMPNVSIVLNASNTAEQYAVGPKGRVHLNGQQAELLKRWLQYLAAGADVSKAGGMTVSEMDILISQVLQYVTD